MVRESDSADTAAISRRVTTMFGFLLTDCSPGKHVPSEVTKSTRPTQMVLTTKNVCRECGHLIVLEDGAWVVDKSRERELEIRMRD